MPIDPDKLLRFAIPEGRQSVTPQDMAFYALSIGMGADPLDSDALAYTDPVRPPRMMPSMVLVLAHPGFWLADPASGVDPAAVLHAAQRFEILGRLPDHGMVTSNTRVRALHDKGPGKPALIFTTTDLTDQAGVHFARLDRTTFVRGGGGFGGDAGTDIADPMPDGEPDHVVDLRTGPDQALLYRLNGDLNPLHSDPVVAASAGFPRPILHGLCTMGVIAYALLKIGNHSADALGSLRMRFAAPVYPGETIRTEAWDDGSFRAKVIERDLLVADRGRVARSDMERVA